MCKQPIYVISFILVLSLVCGMANADPYQQEAGPDGIVSIEAENFDDNIPNPPHTWEFVTEPEGFSGIGAMQNTPADPGGGDNFNDASDYSQNSPRLDFEVNFSRAGIHYVWIRGYGQDGNSDSCHAGINGEPVNSAWRYWGFTSSWTWNSTAEGGERRFVDVPSAGVHTINLWMREDAFIADKIVLTTNPDYTPTDEGPLESSRGPRFKAYGPVPDDDELYPDTWVSLSWAAADTAVSHDVYIGENFDDVNDGTGDTFIGNQAVTFLIVGFPGNPFPEGLVPGVTYYWRIDEVEADGITKFKGDIWSFSIPPKTAYFPDPADGAAGVSVDARLSWTPGFGAIIHNVYFGDNFDDVNNAAGNPPVGTSTFDPGPLEMAKTYYWRVDEFSPPLTHKGDVWSFTTEGAVESLEPANGAVDVSQTPVLTWVPGVFADTHEVFFGSDAAALENRASGSLGSESFEPGQLEWNTTYYWRIDEANNANANSPWIGPLWSFTTANFLIIDDMEGYNDLDPAEPASNRIFFAWLDGFDNPAINGSVVGYANPPFAEQSIVNSGNQSMPMTYDNAVGKSEATLTLSTNRDWTVKGVNTLTIWFRGTSSNTAEQMYVVLNGSARIDHDNPDAALRTAWTEWNIDLQAFADQGVNLANITSITLGLSSVTGGTGTMYFDDIRLHPPAP